MTDDKKYNYLIQNRVQLDNTVLMVKKKLIINNIKKINGNINLSDWLNKDIPLFVAPVSKMYRGKLIVQPTDIGEEIYIDKEFYDNPEKDDVITHQLTHELLHTICRIGKKEGAIATQYFSHDWYDNDGIYLGIDEATTQMFTDDFEGYKLSKKEDPNFYFIKNIMRIMKIVIGEDKLLMQYLNYNNDFEESFNNISNNKFTEFAANINKIYNLMYIINKSKKENKDVSKEVEDVKNVQNIVLNITREIINKRVKNDSNLEMILEQEFIGSSFYKDEFNMSSDSIAYKKFMAVREKAMLIYQFIRSKRLNRGYNQNNKEGMVK